MWPLRRALRMCIRAPQVALAIVALTALGMAGAVALFSPLYRLVLSPLPLPRSEQLVRIGGRLPLFNVYLDRFEDLERFRPLFSHLAAYAPVGGASSARWRLPDSGRIQEVSALAVSPEFFETLGVAPQLGRTLINEAGNASVVVLSDGLWRAHFGASEDILGTSIDIGGQSHVVIGVMPASFDVPRRVDAWMPIGTSPYLLIGLEVVGRLRDGVSASQASAALEAMKLPLAFGPAGQFGATGQTVQPLQAYLRGDTRTTLLTLSVVSIAFLLLACIAVANLLLARSVSREKEIAVQLALGASRSQLVWQFLAETSVPVVAGTIVGAWLSVLGRGWLRTQIPEIAAESRLTPGTMVVAAVLIAVVTIFCALAPALRAIRAARGTLLPGAASAPGSRSSLSPIEALATLQLALALALLSGAGLLVRSLYVQLNVPLGFRPENIVSFKTFLPPSREGVKTEDALRQATNQSMTASRQGQLASRGAEPDIRAEYERNYLLVHQLMERLTAVPGVIGAGVMTPTPFTADAVSSARIFSARVSSRSGPEGPDRGEQVVAIRGAVSPTGFDILGIRLLAGRFFTEADVRDAFNVALNRAVNSKPSSSVYAAIINEALARRLSVSNPIGQYFNSLGQPFVIVGVVSNYQWTPGVPIDRPAVYFPSGGNTATANIVVKARPGTPMATLSHDIDSVVTSLASGAARVAPEALEPMVGAGQHDLRLTLTLLAAFAALGTCVASLGIYAASSLLVRSRRRELGIRLALGASPAAIRRRLLANMSRMLVGFPVGWFLAWILARQLRHLLVSVSASDSATYVVSSAVVAGTTIASVVVPLLRAGRTDPLSVLREN